MKLLAISAAVLGLIPARAPGDGEESVKVTLYVFFSERSRRGAETAKVATSFVKTHPGAVTLRPALLVEDWNGIGKVTEESPLYRTVRELGDAGPIPFYDTEALRLAGSWKITRLPAVVLLRNGRAHVVQGGVPDLDALWRCLQ